MTSLASILTLANQISKPLTHPPCSTHMRDKPWPFQCQQCFEIIILIDKVYIDISIWDDRLSVRYVLQHLSNTSERIINTAENNCQKYDRTNQNCMVHCHCFVCRTYTVLSQIYWLHTWHDTNSLSPFFHSKCLLNSAYILLDRVTIEAKCFEQYC